MLFKFFFINKFFFFNINIYGKLYNLLFLFLIFLLKIYLRIIFLYHLRQSKKLRRRLYNLFWIFCIMPNMKFWRNHRLLRKCLRRAIISWNQFHFLLIIWIVWNLTIIFNFRSASQNIRWDNAIDISTNRLWR